MVYTYDGPVTIFDKVVIKRWATKTIACSPAKARSNIASQYKRMFGLEQHVNVKLPGEIKELEEDTDGI